MDFLLSEPAIVPDVFVTGIMPPEEVADGSMRYTMFAKQRSFEVHDGGVHYIIVNRIIVPMPVILMSIQDTMKTLGISCCGAERLRLAH